MKLSIDTKLSIGQIVYYVDEKQNYRWSHIKSIKLEIKANNHPARDLRPYIIEKYILAYNSEKEFDAQDLYVSKQAFVDHVNQCLQEQMMYSDHYPKSIYPKLEILEELIIDENGVSVKFGDTEEKSNQ